MNKFAERLTRMLHLLPEDATDFEIRFISDNVKYKELGAEYNSHAHKWVIKIDDSQPIQPLKVRHNLTPKEIEEIRQKYSSGLLNMPQLAKLYNVSTTSIHAVVHYKTAPVDATRKNGRHLTKEEIATIREQYKSDSVNMPQLAKMYNVSITAIYNAVKGYTNTNTQKEKIDPSTIPPEE